MLNANVNRIDPSDYAFFRERLAHCRIDSPIGFIGEAYDYRRCAATGEDDALARTAFFLIETLDGPHCFKIQDDGLTEAEFKAVTRDDIDHFDRTLKPL